MAIRLTTRTIPSCLTTRVPSTGIRIIHGRVNTPIVAPLLRSRLIQPATHPQLIRSFSLLNPHEEKEKEKEKDVTEITTHEDHPQWKELFQKYWDEAVAKEHEAEKNLSWYRRTKIFMTRYGILGYGIYTLSWASVGMTSWLAIKSGMIDYSAWHWMHMDVLEQWYVNGLETFGIDPEKHPITKDTEDAMVAFAFAKVTKPIQLLFTIGVTPRISRFLGYAPKIPNEKLLRNRVKKRVREAIENLKD